MRLEADVRSVERAEDVAFERAHAKEDVVDLQPLFLRTVEPARQDFERLGCGRTVDREDRAQRQVGVEGRGDQAFGGFDPFRLAQPGIMIAKLAVAGLDRRIGIDVIAVAEQSALLLDLKFADRTDFRLDDGPHLRRDGKFFGGKTEHPQPLPKIDLPAHPALNQACAGITRLVRHHALHWSECQLARTPHK